MGHRPAFLVSEAKRSCKTALGKSGPCREAIKLCMGFRCQVSGVREPGCYILY
ncbi:hypothetical protein D1AOALGA4SA_11963 [Olavius algarvensis Delta 1 endosymbiont]|nr:hypothetical protein D1AOALGA4SA_11963 [Olavius algarvensis Delta 1 endosymbiont]